MRNLTFLIKVDGPFQIVLSRSCSEAEEQDGVSAGAEQWSEAPPPQHQCVPFLCRVVCRLGNLEHAGLHGSSAERPEILYAVANLHNPATELVVEAVYSAKGRSRDFYSLTLLKQRSSTLV